ncbi:flagellar protein FlgN [Eubacteriales bacterium OttesenSCG-928-M02]|nr:flagellar protein FlgN [Eubacteriales bacterium OttesenSCG-928-M02]
MALDKLAASLLDILREERAIYQTLLEKAAEKKDAIIKDDVEALTAITRFEEEAVLAIRKTDKAKEKILQEMAPIMHQAEPPDLSEIIQGVKDGALKADLSNIQVEFQSIINGLSAQNMVNQQLLETQLEYTNFCLELLTQPESVGDFYGSSGQVADPNSEIRRNFIDTKI